MVGGAAPHGRPQVTQEVHGGRAGERGPVGKEKEDELENGVHFFFFSFSLISLIADGPHHCHPACGHKGSSHLSPVHALQFFIAMQVQHSYNSSTNG